MQSHVMPGDLATPLTSMTDVAITQYRSDVSFCDLMKLLRHTSETIWPLTLNLSITLLVLCCLAWPLRSVYTCLAVTEVRLTGRYVSCNFRLQHSKGSDSCCASKQSKGLWVCIDSY